MQNADHGSLTVHFPGKKAKLILPKYNLKTHRSASVLTEIILHCERLRDDK